MVLVLAYSAVLLSFASGLLGLMMNQRQHVLEFSQYWFKKFPINSGHYRSVVADNLEEKQYPVFLRQAVFVLLGLSGVLAILAGLGALISKEIITDQLS